MKRILSVFALSLSLGFASLASAQQTVQCPVDSVTTNITTALPSPWWATPQQGKLTGTEVIVMGGQPTLMCKYWAYDKTVTVQRRAPEGTKNCVASGTAFQCN